MTSAVVRRHAFTLIELLVVIGIISILLAVLLPTLGKVRREGKMTNELAASRQLMQAYLMYTNDAKGWLLPGHVADNNLIGYDDTGAPLSGEPVKRWPWRLMPQVKYGLRGTILVNEQAELFSNRTLGAWAYGLSLGPSFGMNMYGLGGDYNATTRTVTPAWACRKINQVTRSARRIVFASGRGPGLLGTSPGYWRLVPPTVPFEWGATGWTTNSYDPTAEPGLWGYVDPRWSGRRAIVACLDGHSEALALADLRDMTRWAQPADQAGEANWKP